MNTSRKTGSRMGATRKDGHDKERWAREGKMGETRKDGRDEEGWARR